MTGQLIKKINMIAAINISEKQYKNRYNILGKLKFNTSLVISCEINQSVCSMSPQQFRKII
jgi:CRISPR/Cas system-associated protein endoribonuclease Cas2